MPAEAMSPRLRALIGSDGCILKVIVPTPTNPAMVAADYLVARAACIAWNTGFAGASLLSFIGAQIWCAREKGGIAWAYVRATG